MPIETKTKLTTNIDAKSVESLRKDVLEPLSKGIDLEIKNKIRKPLQRAKVQYLRLDSEMVGVFNNLVEDIFGDIEDIKAIFEGARTRDETGIPSKEIKAELSKLNRSVKNSIIEKLRKEYGTTNKKGELSFSIKGTPVSAETLVRLATIANGLAPGNWDDFTAIGKILGLSPAEWEKGHESASIFSIKLAALLRESSLSNDRVTDIKKLLDISRAVDRVDSTFLEPFIAEGKVSGYELLGEIINNEGKDISVDPQISKRIIADLNSGVASNEFVVSFELKKVNQLKGRLARLLGDALRDILSPDGPIGKQTQDLLKKVDPSEISGSPSLVENVDSLLTKLILGKNFRYKKRFKHKAKAKKVALERKGALRKERVNKLPKRNILQKYASYMDMESYAIDAFNIRNLINEILAINVKEEMGSSSEPPINLRYQTGRFAESAKLITLTREEAGTLFGTYTYQRNPYDVFLPSGRLGTAQRDPRIYIESAINKAAISILKKKFPGMVLELR